MLSASSATNLPSLWTSATCTVQRVATALSGLFLLPGFVSVVTRCPTEQQLHSIDSLFLDLSFAPMLFVPLAPFSPHVRRCCLFAVFEFLGTEPLRAVIGQS